MTRVGLAPATKAEDVLQSRAHLLQLQQVVAVSANEATTVEGALQDALNLICAYTGWPVGHAFLGELDNPTQLVSTEIWRLPDTGRFSPFQEETRRRMATVNGGLPGLAVAERRTIWRTGIAHDPACLRADIAAQVGLQTAVAVPVWSVNEVVAVIEFFTDAPEDPQSDLVHVLDFVGTQLGRVVERHRAAQTLQRSEEMFRTVIENSSDVVAVLEASGIMQYLSPSLERLLGWRPAELAGRSALEYIHVDDVARAQAVIADAALHTDATRSVEYRFRNRAGEWRYLEAVIKSARRAADDAGPASRPDERNLVFCSLRDITERHLHEETLRLQSTALEAAANGIVITDRGGVIRWVNPAFTRLTGYTAEEAIGQSLRLMKSGKHGSEFYRWLWDTILAGKVWQGEMINRRKDGSHYVEEMIITPVQDRTGTITNFIAIKQDVSQRKESEEALHYTNERLQQVLAELQAAQQQVIQQERLRALGTMASGIAHDFNNALSPILGFSELLLQRPEAWGDREKVTRYLRLINTSAQDAGNVVRRLRDFYRHREADEFHTAIDFNRIVKDAVALTEPRWRSQSQATGVSIEVATELEPLPPMAGNEADLREVLTNLIFNAVDALSDGGTIHIRTRLVDRHVLLEVQDDGIGMTEEVRKRCLEPFFTTKGQRGSGLGLSMVYGIIERHEGRLEIITAPGEGTTLAIRFPSEPPRPSPAVTPQPVAPLLRLRILMIEDEAPVRAIVSELLGADRHQVTVASDGHEGLEKFQAGQFDVVLVDRAMPTMSGDQVAAAVKSSNPAMPVILLTGFGSMMDAAGEKPPGVDLVLGKPVTMAELRRALQTVTAKV